MFALPQVASIFSALLIFPLSVALADNEKPRVFEKAGNIFIERRVETQKLTNNGKDPVVSPDGKRVAFNRKIVDKECSRDKNLCLEELWLLDLETRAEKRLLELRVDSQDLKIVIREFKNKIFSIDSQTLYFETWLGVAPGETEKGFSRAVHAVNVNGESERFITFGGNPRIVKSAKKNPYGPHISLPGHLVVEKHKEFFPEGIYYDTYWLVSPKGKARVDAGINMGYLTDVFGIELTERVSSASKVFEQNDNIFLELRTETLQLTNAGKDEEPVLSPDGKWTVFNRKIKECSEEEDYWACPSHQLWIMNLQTRSVGMLLEPQGAGIEFNFEKVIDNFFEAEFSPDSKTLYFITPTYATTSAIHAVDVDGTNWRFITTGMSFQTIQGPLEPQAKKYIKNLKEDDWRIFPKSEGAVMTQKALNDEVIGYLLIEKTGIKSICSTKPIEEEGGLKFDDDGKYCTSYGRHVWRALVSPDGSKEIPISEAEH